ncbi:MAG: glycosyltransferase family 1 protein [Candidatus Dormiibacterota bacterium]
MEIGIDASRAFQEQPTGIGVYATQVISRLVDTPPAPLRLYLNRRSPPQTALQLPAGSEWRCLPFPRGWTAVRLRWELRHEAPTLLWVPAYRLPPGRLPRSVVTVHGVEHRFAPLAYPGQQARAVESFVLDTLRRASRVITPSETTKADLVHLYQANPNLITVIPHGIADELRPIAPERRESLLRDLAVQLPYFLVVGAHHPRKNVPFLIEQFARAFPNPQFPEVRLVVTNAAGEPGRELLARADQLGLGGRVCALGHVSGERLAALYSGALAACVPSLYEGFGLPALEAMACGAPVLATDVGGVQEIAEGAALLVPDGDQNGWVEGLRRLLNEPGLREHLRALGLDRAGRFSWDRSAQAHAELLASELRLASDPRSPS